ncbi:MAG: class II fructose-bisphosphate aldolase [Planctomycetota bacterium]
MGLVTLKEILPKAQSEHYAIVGFEGKTAEEIKAIIETAAQERSPVIVQVYHGHENCLGAGAFVEVVKYYAEKAKIPVAAHLDHAVDMDNIRECLEAGFPSVMIDASARPLNENIRIVREVVKMARRFEASVEAELGNLGTLTGVPAAERWKFLTDPEEAREFVAETGVDALAVAIGTAHGAYDAKPELDFERLRQLREVVSIPLVMHGGSGTPAKDVRRAISLGISKINIGTEIGNAFTSALRHVAKSESKVIWSTDLMSEATKRIGEVVRRKIEEFGSRGKA